MLFYRTQTRQTFIFISDLLPLNYRGFDSVLRALSLQTGTSSCECALELQAHRYSEQVERKMSVAIESQGDLPLTDDLQHAQDAQSDLGDGSSSLSDIEQDVDQDDGQDGLDDDMESDEASEEEDDEEEEENDSEAETERLDVSPDKKRTHKDVVLNSHTESHTFERAPSNLHGQYGAEEDEEEESDEEDNPPGDISDDELSLPESPKTAAEEEAVADAADDAAAATAQLAESIAQPKDIMHAFDLTNKKRKRSQLLDVDSADATDNGEPLRKRTGSVQPTGDEFAIDDNASARGDEDTPNPVSGDLSDAESVDGQEEDEEAEHPDEKQKLHVDEELEERIEVSEELRTSKRRRKSTLNGKEVVPDEANEPSDKHAVKLPATASDEGEEAEDNVEVEADDAEAALRDEEERELIHAPCIAWSELTIMNRGEKAHSPRAIDGHRATFFVIQRQTTRRQACEAQSRGMDVEARPPDTPRIPCYDALY